jgi:tRNA(fMet)-specific endonuclease VapC
MICLDSSFIIDYLKGDLSAKKILLKYKKEKIFVSEFTVFEVAEGLIYSLKKNKNKQMFNIFFEFLETIEILPLTNFFSLEAAKIRANLSISGKKIDSLDSLIAGSMIANNIYKIITRNTQHFSRIKNIMVLEY